ncbi:MAG: hypothetical protein FVQ83_02635 [Chloroflexi bacterium]|nr:hypothetical protein [Chloroflexota bacterium]
MRKFHLFFTLVSIAIAGVIHGSVVKAQSSFEIFNPSVNYLFGDYIAFEASIIATEPIQEVTISFRGENQTETRYTTATLDGEFLLNGVYELDQGGSIQAFTKVMFWFDVTFDNGSTRKSPIYNFNYDDNRFDWLTIEDPPFTVHSQHLDRDFAQAVLDTAHFGVSSVQDYIPIQAPLDVDIYVYANSADLQFAMQLTGQTWIAGHSNPELGVALVSLMPGPEQGYEMERQVPHEITHIMIYQAIGDGYTNIPLWFSEGIASIAELYPNPDYRQNLLNAAENDYLIPLVELCTAFPTDAAGAGLAYAEATSFTRYLHQEFGPAGLRNLVDNYATGPGCENGTQAVYESSLTQLERQWLAQIFEESSIMSAFKELLPWFSVFLISISAPLTLILIKWRQPPEEDY